MDTKNLMYRDEDDDEEEVDEQVTLIDSSGDDEKKNKKKSPSSPRSSLMKQGSSDKSRKKKTCRFLDTNDLESGKESGSRNARDTSGEDEDDEDDADAVAAVGKILIFKPRGQSKKVKRRKCCIRLIIFCFVIAISLTVGSIFFKKSLHLNIASLDSLIGSRIRFTHATVTETRCDLNSTLAWKQSIPFIINPVIQVAQSPVYRSSSAAAASAQVAARGGGAEKSHQKKVLQSSDMIVIAFETGVDAPMYPIAATCDLYFPSNHKLRQHQFLSERDLLQSRPFANSRGCGGGVMAIDPVDGSIIWSLLVKHAVKSISCTLDINKDGFNDCFITGTNALLMSMDGMTGQILWSISHEDLSVHQLSSNLAPLILSNDAKGAPANVLVINTGIEQEYPDKIPAQLLIISSDGQIVRHLQLWLGTPGKPIILPETVISPLQMIDSDGTSTIVFAGESKNSLYAIPLADLMEGRLSNRLLTINDDVNSKSHITIQPIIANCNADTVNDIIVTFNNGTVACYDGKKLTLVWKNNAPIADREEIKISPTVGKITSSDYVLLVTRSLIHASGDIHYIVDMRRGRTLKRIPMVSFNRHSDIHYEPSPPITLSTRESPDLFILWSTLSNLSVNCTGEGKKSVECSFYGLVSMALDENSQFKFTGIYNAIDGWNDELKSLEDAFSTNELMSKWTHSDPLNEMNGQFDANVPYDASLYSGMSEADILNFGESREKRETAKSKSMEKMERGFSTPALIEDDKNAHSSSLVFASWWQPVKSIDTLALPISNLIEACVQKFLSSPEMQKLKEDMKDQQYFPQYMERLCRKRLSSSQRHSLNSVDNYSDDLLNHQLGSFTLYRYNVKCKSDAHIAPMSDQLWPQLNGWLGLNVLHINH